MTSRAEKTAALFVPVALCLVCLGVDPALANKFETIGSGVSGSYGIKREWLEGFFYILCGIFASTAVLAMIIPRSNPLFLNHVNWKKSAAVLAILAAAAALAGYLI